MDSSSNRWPEAQRKRPRVSTRSGGRKGKSQQDDDVHELSLAVQRLNAGTVSHYQNKSARECRCMSNGLLAPSGPELAILMSALEALCDVSCHGTCHQAAFVCRANTSLLEEQTEVDKACSYLCTADVLLALLVATWPAILVLHTSAACGPGMGHYLSHKGRSGLESLHSMRKHS